MPPLSSEVTKVSLATLATAAPLTGPACASSGAHQPQPALTADGVEGTSLRSLARDSFFIGRRKISLHHNSDEKQVMEGRCGVPEHGGLRRCVLTRRGNAWRGKGAKRALQDGHSAFGCREPLTSQTKTAKCCLQLWRRRRSAMRQGDGSHKNESHVSRCLPPSGRACMEKIQSLTISAWYLTATIIAPREHKTGTINTTRAATTTPECSCASFVAACA